MPFQQFRILLLLSMFTLAAQDQLIPEELVRSTVYALNTTQAQNLDASPYFNTSFLARHNRVKKRLLRIDHFQDVYFKTQDNYILNGLLRLNNKARATIIMVCGWHCAKKEHMAPLTQMFNEEEFNLMLIDPRGQGKSEGKGFWRNLLSMGKDTHLDVIAAMDYINRLVRKPIILWGTCTGAFSCARAAIAVAKQNLLCSYRLQGVIFDSGWSSPKDVVIQNPIGYLEKTFPKAISIISTKTYQLFYRLFLKERLSLLETQIKLLDTIELLPIPVFYIHSLDDNRAHFDAVKQLYDRTHRKHCWWPEGSAHSTLHLKYKYEYQQRMMQFCRLVLQ